MEEIIKRIALALLFISVIVSIAYSAAGDLIALPDEAVARKTLANGLTVLAKRSPPAGLVAIDIRIKTGSSLEGEFTGSGISHLLEHMVFKGTANRRDGAIEKEVRSYGGTINGFTSHDLTGYSLILPAKYLPQGLLLLKDMLTNASIRDDELAREKEVVLKEIRMNNDEPQSRLVQLMNETAYIDHTYRFPTIGYEDNLKALTSNDLKKYYSTRYMPCRMVVTVVGDVETPLAIQEVEKTFGSIVTTSYYQPDIPPVEPAQTQPRQAIEHMETSLAYLAMGYHSTGILNDDLYAMDVLSMILGRGDNSRLNSVLYKDKGLVHTIAAVNYTPRDPGIFAVTAVLDTANVEPAIKSINEQVAAMRAGVFSDEELESAKRMIISDFISTLETIEGQAGDMSSNYLLTGSERFSGQYVNGILSVTKDDVKRVANKYLKDSGLTTVTILPKNIADKDIASSYDITQSDKAVTKTELPNGLRVIVREDKKIPTVAITAALLGGSSVETPENNGISNFVAEMMLEGTVSRPDSGKIKGAIESLGGGISVFCGANTFGITISALKGDTDTALEILKDVLTNAIFSQRDIEKKKDLITAQITEQDEDIFDIGVNALKKEMFAGSAYELRNIGAKDSVNALKKNDLVAFYKKYYVPNNIVIAVSGDVKADRVIEKIKELFTGMPRADIAIAPISVKASDNCKTKKIDLDKEQSLMVMGFKTVSRKSPDVYPLEVLNSILGGFSGRIFGELRVKRSLAYTLGCGETFWADTGMFIFYVATTREMLPEARTALISEIRKIRSQPISASELEQAKLELVSHRMMSAQSGKFFTYNFAGDELYGLGYDNLYKYTSAIQAVTADDVKKVADEYLDPERSVEIIISPGSKEAKADK